MTLYKIFMSPKLKHVIYCIIVLPHRHRCLSFPEGGSTDEPNQMLGIRQSRYKVPKENLGQSLVAPAFQGLSRIFSTIVIDLSFFPPLLPIGSTLQAQIYKVTC